MRWSWNAASLLPCCLVAESHLPAAVPGRAVSVLAEVSPGQARGCLADFGLEGCPGEETRAREETVVLHIHVCTSNPRCRHMDTPRTCSALHRTQPGQKCRTERINKQGPMPAEFTLSTARVFLPFFPSMFFVCFFFWLHSL